VDYKAQAPATSPRMVMTTLVSISRPTCMLLSVAALVLVLVIDGVEVVDVSDVVVGGVVVVDGAGGKESDGE